MLSQHLGKDSAYDGLFVASRSIESKRCVEFANTYLRKSEADHALCERVFKSVTADLHGAMYRLPKDCPEDSVLSLGQA